MAAIDDLQAQAKATEATLKALTDKLASNPPSTDPQVIAVTAELKAVTDAANAALTPPAPPA